VDLTEVLPPVSAECSAWEQEQGSERQLTAIPQFTASNTTDSLE
jgi:hypothetical protein